MNRSMFSMTWRLLCSFALVLFTTAVAGQQAPAPDRSQPPLPGPAPELRLPAVQKRQLASGLPVWIVELHGVPVAQVNLVVLSGSAADPAGKFGLANLTADMLDEGAGSRSALELADAVDFLGASVAVTSTSDASVIRLHVPVARLGDALAIMADVAARPTFPSDELERLRVQRLTSLLQARDEPETIAQLAFARVLYGRTHRYGTAQAGTAQTIQAFTVDDLRAFYTAHVRPDNAALLVVGDVTPDRAMPLLEASFGAWRVQGSRPPPPALPSAPQHAVRRIYLVDKPDAPQSQIRIGWIGVPRSSPDYFPIQVMNTILGGSFLSRLNLNLREQHGYTYGAFSAFDMRLLAGPFSAAAGVQTDKTADALKEFFKELGAIAGPVPADELTKAKNYLALRFPSRFETTGDISQRLEEALVYRLPDDYFSQYVAKVQAVTEADVRRVARQYVQPERFAIVIAGDRKAIEAQIRALNLGEVQVVTIDDVFGPAPAISP
jgi:predicted Zn-dependent peptidase